MAHPLLEKIEKYFGLGFLARAERQVVGLAQDFWKDGDQNLLDILKIREKSSSALSSQEDLNPSDEIKGHLQSIAKGQLWHAAPAEISERMWGEGFVSPGAQFITDLMVKPLGINKEMNVLDLSAGLGGLIRKIVKDYGAYITGLEPDPEVAKRGMELSQRAGKAKHASIEHYNPESLSLTRLYDCIIARETVYRVKDKEKFLTTLSTGLKARGQVVFTDYIVNPEDRENPAILAWQQFETLARPIGLVEMAEVWAKTGVKLRVNEDLSEYYKKEIQKGLQKLATFLATGVQPDAETKIALQRRIKMWAHRSAAMEQGMKFYRFYGTKIPTQ